MRNYRLVLLLKSDIKKEKRDALFADIKKIVPDLKHEKITELGEKKLAYPIRKDRTGNYLLSEFESSQIPLGFYKKMSVNEMVLRYLLVRTK